MIPAELASRLANAERTLEVFGHQLIPANGGEPLTIEEATRRIATIEKTLSTYGMSPPQVTGPAVASPSAPPRPAEPLIVTAAMPFLIRQALGLTNQAQQNSGQEDEVYQKLQRAEGTDVKLILKSGAELQGTITAVADGAVSISGAVVDSSQVAAIVPASAASTPAA